MTRRPVATEVSSRTCSIITLLRAYGLPGASADPQLRTGLQVRRPTHLLGRLLSAAENNEEFLITGVDWPTRDGSGIRDFIHVWDLAQAHVQALRRFDAVVPPSGSTACQVINLGSGSGTTVREFVTAFIAATGADLKIREAGPRPGDVVGSSTRSELARELLDWTPQLSVEQAIRDSQRWSAIRDERLAD